ncbi:zf-DNL-domain-containing protein [Serendipita vermifera]|nr:zf-DNL-domain-containing protein [Serendipita vermifera]
MRILFQSIPSSPFRVTPFRTTGISSVFQARSLQRWSAGHAHMHNFSRQLSTTSRLRQQTPVPDAQKDVDRRLQMTFTCTAPECGHRSTHEFSAHAYQHGIVLLTCPGCKNRHLIADHIGWFKESTQDGKLKTVEDLLRARGEEVKRGQIGKDGVIEYYPPSEDAKKSDL